RAIVCILRALWIKKGLTRVFLIFLLNLNKNRFKNG
ncbi:diaminopimelate epimerase, partial [Chlamydia psittaci C1/97]